jgi:alkanesulfonate monooxygenase SsuD/methylene tetrahydromethanopterin reductase-like flavin-dependent oxidoreductase (luciferase family)
MGARGKNFYYDLAARYGYQDAADDIQAAYLSGDRGAAMARVPAELIDEVALVGPVERVRERLALWQASPVTTLNMTVFDVETLRAVVDLVPATPLSP